MPLQATSGAASYDAFGGGVPAVPNYIEDVFSTYLYTGNGSTQTITNGIDLSGEGGLVWWKNRTNATGHGLIDTTRGIDYYLSSNTTDAQDGPVSYISSVSSTGYSIGAGTQFVNQSANNYVSWTFRKQPKFFDVVTYTGNGTSKTITHNLGSVPGCIFVKRTDTTGNWIVHHRGLSSPNSIFLKLNSTAAQDGNGDMVNGTSSTTFSVGSEVDVNASGGTYVAYLFAHDAGGFGLTGTDNVISCGSFTTDGSGVGTVNLGYEPQWILAKRSDDVSQWYLADNMRGMPVSGSAARLFANLSNAESTSTLYFQPTATGFGIPAGFFDAGATCIYIAIRRGPMKVPTSGTSVFAPVTYTGNATDGRAITTGFVPDTVWWKSRSNATNWRDATLLIGTNTTLSQNLTAAEENVPGYYIKSYQNTGFTYDAWDSSYNQSGYTYIVDAFQRAPSFHDVVCYTGTGSATTFSHNLGVAPEMMIVKGRTNTFSWFVYQKDLTSANESFLTLNTDSSATSGSAVWNSTSPTSSVFSVGSANAINQSGNTYVAYLFATCAGVSKVGSYTGTATTKQVDCGFTGGARFVLIKRTDSTGSWYVWDVARGISSGNDPYLLLNSTAAEVTNTDYIDAYSAGFEISSTAPAEINASGGSFIFLAIS